MKLLGLTHRCMATHQAKAEHSALPHPPRKKARPPLHAATRAFNHLAQKFLGELKGDQQTVSPRTFSDFRTHALSKMMPSTMVAAPTYCKMWYCFCSRITSQDRNPAHPENILPTHFHSLGPNREEQCNWDDSLARQLRLLKKNAGQ